MATLPQESPENQEPPPDRPFLVRGHNGRLHQAPAVHVTWRETRRVKRETYVEGLGPIREVEHDGWDHSALTVGTAALGVYGEAGWLPPVLADGRHTRTGDGDTVANNSTGVRRVVRSLRPPHAAALDALDEQIAAAQALVARLRKERAVVAGEAWARGGDIQVHLLRPENGETVRRLGP